MVSLEKGGSRSAATAGGVVRASLRARPGLAEDPPDACRRRPPFVKGDSADPESLLEHPFRSLIPLRTSDEAVCPGAAARDRVTKRISRLRTPPRDPQPPPVNIAGTISPYRSVCGS